MTTEATPTGEYRKVSVYGVTGWIVTMVEDTYGDNDGEEEVIVGV